LRKREIETKSYGPYEELIWKAPAEPKIEDAKKAIISFKKLDIQPEGIELAKYVPHEFTWLHMHINVIEKELKNKKSKKGKNRSKFALWF